jgi:hypothetical protein
MKKIVILFLLTFLLTACAAQVAGLQQLPDEGVNLVFMLVTFVVAFLLLKLSEATGFDFKGYAGAIVAVVAPILVGYIESYLRLIPPMWDDIVLTVIHLIVLAVGSLGMFWVYHRKTASPSLH